MAFTDRELLARLIQCEAGGEGDDGMRAVATVIMNRTYATEGEFARVSEGGNVRNIILQPGQFGCVYLLCFIHLNFPIKMPRTVTARGIG